MYACVQCACVQCDSVYMYNRVNSHFAEVFGIFVDVRCLQVLNQSLCSLTASQLVLNCWGCSQWCGKMKWYGNWNGLPTQIHVHIHRELVTHILHMYPMDYVYLVVIWNSHYQFLQFIGRALIPHSLPNRGESWYSFLITCMNCDMYISIIHISINNGRSSVNFRANSLFDRPFSYTGSVIVS